MEYKAFWKSRSLWFGLLYILTGVAGVFGWAEFQPSPQVVELGAVVTGIVIILLRLVTKQPLG